MEPTRTLPLSSYL
uniref:Uncharacterized protein n=1 Tax=Arundo donax TaxID=35708 RepID=A0A0A9FHJ0_ARUDO